MSIGLLIRADADERIGVGHAMRCLALAQAWIDANRGPVWLVSRNLPGWLRDRYQREGVRVRLIDRGVSAFSTALRESGAGWVVLDGYDFGMKEQSEAMGEARLLVVDDDGALRDYACDVIVDANVFADERAYARRRAGTRLLLGPQYALLRREMRGARPSKLSRSVTARVLVTFGGADPAGLSVVAAEALRGIDADVTLVLGPANACRGQVERAATLASNINVVSNVTNMRDLMDVADLALVGAGSTCLELAHAGVPQVVVAAAENQKRVAQELAERGVARSLGNASNVHATEIREAVVSLLADPPALRAMRVRGVGLVDGRGALRVLEAMVIP